MNGGILNIISILATLIVAEGIIYFVCNLIFGKLSLLNKTVLQQPNLRLKHFLFLLLGLILLLTCFDFYKPW